MSNVQCLVALLLTALLLGITMAFQQELAHWTLDLEL